MSGGLIPQWQQPQQQPQQQQGYGGYGGGYGYGGGWGNMMGGPQYGGSSFNGQPISQNWQVGGQNPNNGMSGQQGWGQTMGSGQGGSYNPSYGGMMNSYQSPSGYWNPQTQQSQPQAFPAGLIAAQQQGGQQGATFGLQPVGTGGGQQAAIPGMMSAVNPNGSW